MFDSIVPRKEERILEDDAEHAAQVLDIDFADVDAVEEDLSALDVVEAEEQRDQSGLAGAGVADDGDGLAGGDAEGDIAEDPVVFGGFGFVGVAEPDVAEFDFAARGFEADGVGGRDAGAGSSRSLKMRSEAAMADCRMLNFSLRSWIGRKKRVAYIVKAVRTPRLRVLLSTRLPPDQ